MLLRAAPRRGRRCRLGSQSGSKPKTGGRQRARAGRRPAAGALTPSADYFGFLSKPERAQAGSEVETKLKLLETNTNYSANSLHNSSNRYLSLWRPTFRVLLLALSTPACALLLSRARLCASSAPRHLSSAAFCRYRLSSLACVWAPLVSDSGKIPSIGCRWTLNLQQRKTYIPKRRNNPSQKEQPDS